MTYNLERGRGGLSKLDERLEAFRDPETGHIIFTPEDAKNILLNTLLGEYRWNVSNSVPPLNQPSPKIEALVQIVEMKLPGDKFDYTDTVESINRKRVQQNQKRKEMEEESHIITPAPPPQAEI